MALDPSIILGIKPADTQPIDPVKQYTAVAQARAAAQEGQLRQLQIQEVTRQQATQAAVDANLSKATVVDPSTGKINVDRATALQGLKAGGFGSAAVGLQEGWEKGDLAKTKEALDNQKTILGNQKAHVEAMGGLANAIQSAPKEQQPILYAQVRASAIQRGIIDPSEMPSEYNPSFVQGVQAQSMKASEMLTAQHQKVEEGQKSVDLAQQASRNAATAMYEQQEIAARRQSDATTQRGQNLTDARQRQTLAIEQGRLNFQKNQAGLADDGQPLPIVDAIGTGRINSGNLSRILTKNPALIAAVAQKYPDFDTSKVDAYTALVKQIEGGGKEGQQLNSGATVAKHLQELSVLNTAASRIPGTAAHQAYQNKVDTLAPELAGFYGHSTDTAIKDLKGTLNATFNRDSAIKTQAGSMLDKLDTFEQQWKDAAPSKVYEAHLPTTITNAQEGLRSFVGGKTTSVAAPETHVFKVSSYKGANPNAAAAAAKAQGYTVVP